MYDGEKIITMADFEDLYIEVRKLRRENKKLKAELEEYKMYESDEIA